MTLIELLVVVVIVAVLLALLLTALAPAKVKSSKINCFSKLKQITLGFRIWSNDNGDRFPWAVPASEGGTLEYATTTQIFCHFLVASNELSSPKILTCNSDLEHAKTADWSLLNNSTLSYFIGLESDTAKPNPSCPATVRSARTAT